MIIVYYRRKDGTIRSAHTYPEERGLDAAMEGAMSYNEERMGEDTAYILGCADNSIEAYLYQKSVEKLKLDRETVNDLVSHLEDALDAAHALEG